MKYPRLAMLIALAFTALVPLEAAARGGSPPCDLQALDAETKDNVAAALGLARFEPNRIPQSVQDRLCSPKNSAAAFGERTRFRLADLLAHPDSLTPPYNALYGTMASYAGAQSPHQAYVLLDFLGQDRSRGYRPLPDAANLTFPADNAVDPESQFGWYYVVGNARGDNGKRYGVLLMLYRVSLLSPSVAAHFGLSGTENQVVDMQLAITEAGDRNYQSRPTLIAGTTGLIQLKANTFFMTQGRNGVSSPDGQVVPMRVTASGADRGVTPPVDLAIDLRFSAAKNYLLQGDDGCLPCCGKIGTLYYSIPRLRLDASASTIKLKGQTVRLTDGEFWLDHQRGTLGNVRVEAFRAFINTQPAGGPPGWDFFVAQFQGNREMTFVGFHTDANARFYNQTGPQPPAGVMTVPVVGKYMDANAVQVDAKGTLRVTDWVKSTSTPNPSQYTVTNAWYPNRWEFEFGPEVPADIRRFSMAPIVTTGASLFFATGQQYQEAPVDILDTDGRLVGSGYAEAVAYAAGVPTNFQNRLRLAGLPDTPEMIALLDNTKPSPELVGESLLYLLDPAHQQELQQALTTCKTGQ